MRYALIGDVHANLPALEAVLADVESKRPDVVYHLGDLVGYAPWPNEVVDRVRGAGVQGIAGNYDSTIAAGERPPGEDEASASNFEWTARETTRALARRY